MSTLVFSREGREQAREMLLAVARADGHDPRRENRTPDNSRISLYLDYATVSVSFGGRHLYLKVRLAHRVGLLYGNRNIGQYWSYEMDPNGACIFSRIVFTTSLQKVCESLANILDFARANRA